MTKQNEKSLAEAFIPPSEGEKVLLVLADINGFSDIMRTQPNSVVTNFLHHYHSAIEEYCDHNDLGVKHESGDSFWIIAKNERDINEISNGILTAYNQLIGNYQDIKSIQNTGLRMTYTSANVLAYTVAGETHYNSQAHSALRIAIENMPRIKGIMPLSDLWDTSSAPSPHP